jgi:hypothetical protein
MAYRNSCKKLGVIQRSDQKLRRFWAVMLVWLDETCSSSSSDSIATTRKTTSGNNCKNLSTIQLSDQNLDAFLLITLVWHDRTFASQSRDSIATTTKMAYRNSCKNPGVIHRSDQNLRRIWAIMLVRLDETSSYRVAIPFLPQGKQLPETTVKIWARSHGRIKT